MIKKTTFKADIRQMLSAIVVVFSVLAFYGPQQTAFAANYHIDSVNGKDSNNGLAESTAWKSHTKVYAVTLQPGDSVRFKRGSQFSGPIAITESGTAANPILLTDYGTGDAPRFTNPDDLNLNGNCIRIMGDYIIIENLYFHDTPATENADRLNSIFRMGAVANLYGSDHNIIRDNVFINCTKAIQSTGEYTLITNNYLDGPSHALWWNGVASGGWGPMGIQLGIGNQEVSYNTIKNYLTEESPYGTDGGAIEFDDGRYHKDNLYIHHNYSEGNAGFLESSWAADYNPYVQEVHNLRVAFNVNKDGQSYCYMFAPTHDTYFDNNTIIRANDYPNPNAGFVEIVYSAYSGITFRNNLLVGTPETDNRPFNGSGVISQNNWYWEASTSGIPSPDLANGDFEQGVPSQLGSGADARPTGWGQSGWGQSGSHNDDAPPSIGSKSLKMWSDDTGLWQSIAGTAGQSYDFSVQVQDYSGDTAAITWDPVVAAYFWTQAGDYISHREFSLNSATMTNDLWYTLSGTATAPANTYWVQIQLYLKGRKNGIGGSIYFDNASIEGADTSQNNPLLMDFDGDDYRLSSNSPLIGQGQNLSQHYSTDFAGAFLPSSGSWDIGAYRYVGANLDGIGTTNLADFALLAAYWLEPICDVTNNYCQGADINGINGVDISDLMLIAADWLD